MSQEQALAARVGAALSRAVDPAVTQFAERLAGGADVLAVLFYGSNLRTGSLEGVLDFYVLTGGEAERGLWPRVSYREWEHDGAVLRAKIATMTLAKFAAACQGGSRDTTVWARFVQPSVLVWAKDHGAREAVAAAICAACVTAARLAAALGPPSGPQDQYWSALFRETYKAELRVEKPGRERSILDLNRAHFDSLLALALRAAGIGFALADGGDAITPVMPPNDRARVLAWWRRRRRWGKVLNIARLLRAARTFDGAGRYAAWKVERHTGVQVTVTPWRERHPVLAAPAVLWQVWRARKQERRQP